MVIGMSAFFLQNMRPVSRVNRIMYSFLSGRYVPLVLMPAWLSTVNDLLFYRYTFAFPLEIVFVLHEIDIGTMFIKQMIWVVLMIFIFNLVFKLGIKRYEAVGA